MLPGWEEKQTLRRLEWVSFREKILFLDFHLVIELSVVFKNFYIFSWVVDCQPLLCWNWNLMISLIQSRNIKCLDSSEIHCELWTWEQVRWRNWGNIGLLIYCLRFHWMWLSYFFYHFHVFPVIEKKSRMSQSKVERDEQKKWRNANQNNKKKKREIWKTSQENKQHLLSNTHRLFTKPTQVHTYIHLRREIHLPDFRFHLPKCVWFRLWGPYWYFFD